MGQWTGKRGGDRLYPHLPPCHGGLLPWFHSHAWCWSRFWGCVRFPLRLYWRNLGGYCGVSGGSLSGAKKIAGNPKFRAIDEAVGREGFKIVLLTRLSPVFPFNLLNYAYGVTGVSLKDYVLASVGMIPGTMMYVYIGSLAGSLATLGTGPQPTNPGVQWAIRIIGFIATVAVTVYVTRVARKALAEAVPDPE
jgi:SNARE associated Golgi protein